MDQGCDNDEIAERVKSLTTARQALFNYSEHSVEKIKSKKVEEKKAVALQKETERKQIEEASKESPNKIIETLIKFLQQKVRDFMAQMPILKALGVDEYDKMNLDNITLDMGKFLKMFKQKWKTLDEERILYLLKYGIV